MQVAEQEILFFHQGGNIVVKGNKVKRTQVPDNDRSQTQEIGKPFAVLLFADSDDLKFDPFGTASSSRASYDWSDREDLSSGLDRRPQTTAQRQETTSFGSSESVTHPSVPKVTTFPSEDSGSSGGGDRFEAFARFGTAGDGGEEGDDDDFGDFASTVSEKSDSPPVAGEAGSEVTAGSEGWDEFGAFQGDKPKFGKLDFLKASSQTKVKSSEEMIKNELATFDLSVQGEILSHLQTPDSLSGSHKSHAKVLVALCRLIGLTLTVTRTHQSITWAMHFELRSKEKCVLGHCCDICQQNKQKLKIKTKPKPSPTNGIDVHL